MVPSTPAPIDPRGPRFNQAVLAVALLAGFVLDWRPVVPAFALVLLLGAAFGPRWGPFLRLYAVAVRPRLGPPVELEDPRPPRFAAALGVVVLTAASVAFLAGSPATGWALALLVASLAGLSASTGICIGCEVYLWVARRRRRTGSHAAAYFVTGDAGPRLPADLLAGAEHTWVVFTTPFCVTCGPVEAHLRAADPGARVVRIDATKERRLSDDFRIRAAPTVLRADTDGSVDVRLVGAAAVDRYLAAQRPGAAGPRLS